MFGGFVLTWTHKCIDSTYPIKAEASNMMTCKMFCGHRYDEDCFRFQCEALWKSEKNKNPQFHGTAFLINRSALLNF